LQITVFDSSIVDLLRGGPDHALCGGGEIMSGVGDRSIVLDVDDPGVQRSSWIKNAAIILLKLTVTGACFWYVTREQPVGSYGVPVD
jgi:hypothetical protein